MEIKTKFELNQEVWVLYNSKAKKGTVIEIVLRVSRDNPLFQISFEGSFDYSFRDESEVFASKEELLNYVASE